MTLVWSFCTIRLTTISILTKIKNTMINILCIIFTYKCESGSCDSSLWQALTKIILDLYIYNFHYKQTTVYMHYGQINIFWFWFWFSYFVKCVAQQVGNVTDGVEGPCMIFGGVCITVFDAKTQNFSNLMIQIEFRKIYSFELLVPKNGDATPLLTEKSPF